jgi:hypothetical protein
MKINKLMNKAGVIVLIIMIASGCLEYTTTTRLLPDGSIERIMRIEGDSASVLNGSLPVPVDSSWEISTGYENKLTGDSTSKRVYVYKARKVFRNYQELNKEIFSGPSRIGKINRKVTTEKRFRWFNTFYRYSETYMQLFPIKRHPVDEFLTDDELTVVHGNDDDYYYSSESDKLIIKTDTLIRPVLSGQDSIRKDELEKSLEKKYTDWMKSNLYEEFYEVLKGSLAAGGNMKPDEIDKTRDSLFAFFNKTFDIEAWFTDDSSSSTLLELASNYYHIDSAVLHAANQKGFDSLSIKLDNIFIGFEDSFNNQAIMPGLIIATNSTELKGNTASWKLDSENFFEKDYTIWVESKKVNKGTFILSGVLVALMLLGLGAGMVKKK